MATTGIWKIEKRLDNVLNYTTNAEKTMSDESYRELHNVIEYIESDYKTEEQHYVTGINCSPSTALEEMTITKKEYNKTGGILAYHAFQSFAEGEVTPEQAHEIGIKLAEEMWGNRFEVVVSTHLNSKHFHNHFVINSVSFADGKRYYNKRETYAEIRRISDALCEEYGLSVIQEKPCRNSKVNYLKYQKEYVEKNNYYTTAKQDLDRAIAMAYNYEDFEKLMKAMDYELIYRANKLSIKRSPYKKNIRIQRYFGEEYSIDNITDRISKTYAPRVPFMEAYGINTKYYPINLKKRPPSTGIYGLYLHYCYLLKVFPQKHKYQKLPPSIRADVRKMDMIAEEVRLLVSKEINTNEQFFSYKKEIVDKYEDLMTKRSRLWNQHKKSKSRNEKESIHLQIEEINKELNPLRKEVGLCDDIEKRIPTIRKNLDEFYSENERKEVSKDEHIR